MDEYKTEKAVYTANDFVLWKENKLFVISPKFQRPGRMANSSPILLY